MECLNGEAIGNIHYGDIHARYMASSIDLDKIANPQARDKKFSPEKKDFLVDGDLLWLMSLKIMKELARQFLFMELATKK